MSGADPVGDATVDAADGVGDQVPGTAAGDPADAAGEYPDITEDTVLKAPMIYSPLGLFDCCPTTDGAAAAVLCRADRAREFRADPDPLTGR
mgnify:CR=1 FL=1